jgi:3',5'-cyclic AMP phosphodiesterase CpdA
MQRNGWGCCWLAGALAWGASLGAAAFPPARAFDPRPLMAAARARAKEGRFRFVVLGDSKNNRPFRDVLRLTDSFQPDFVLTTGDLVDRGAGPSGRREYDRLAERAGEFLRRVPTWPVMGNHEVNGGDAAEARANFERFFGLTESNYTFDVGPARFIGLTWPAPDRAGRAWLKEQLAEARGRLIFIFQHNLYYTVGSQTQVPNTPDELTRLFTRYQVTAVFQGHDHGYYRTRRDGVWYLTSAGAGAQIYRLNRCREAQPDDVFYGLAPREGAPVGPDRYWLHGPGGHDRSFERPRYFVVVVDVNGPQVTARMVTTAGEELDVATVTAPHGHHPPAVGTRPAASKGRSPRPCSPKVRMLRAAL